MISVIIRTKNEERWIGQCLRAVFSQDFGPLEVILVDNESTDSTLQKAAAFDVKVLKIGEFSPGRAINLGIRSSEGDIIVCLSGHCIPVTQGWLRNLVAGLQDPRVAGVYGRQEPLSFTPDTDKRDLITVFGLDPRRQKRDPFFHNANSAFRRDVWERFQFDETVTNIEDRVWGQEVIRNGFELAYEPEASVYHYHGIHHNLERTRTQNVVRVIESLSVRAAQDQEPPRQPAAGLGDVVAIVPVVGPVQYCGGRPLVEYTIARAREAESISRVVVSTDNPEIVEIARHCGAEAPFLRPEGLCAPGTPLGEILNHALEELGKSKLFPDGIVYLASTYPFRPRGFLDHLIGQFVSLGLETLIPVQDEIRTTWFRTSDAIEMLTPMAPRHLKSEHLYVSLLGLGSVTLPRFVRERTVIGKTLGVQLIKDKFLQLEVRDESSFSLAGAVIEAFFRENRQWTDFPTTSTVQSPDASTISKLLWHTRDGSGALVAV